MGRSALRSAYGSLKDGWGGLRGSPRELHIVFVLKVLESYNYFSLSRILVLYLSEDFSFSDTRAGFYFGLWGTLLTVYGSLLGTAIDFLGIKRSLVVCFLLNVTTRLAMAATGDERVMLAMLLGPNAVAATMGVPVMTIAVKRYTEPINRGFAFSLFYSLMNVAALVQGLAMDTFRITWKDGFRLSWLPPDSLLNSGNRLFLASGCLTSLAGLLLTFTLHEAPLGPPDGPLGAPTPKHSRARGAIGTRAAARVGGGLLHDAAPAGTAALAPRKARATRGATLPGPAPLSAAADAGAAPPEAEPLLASRGADDCEVEPTLDDSDAWDVEAPGRGGTGGAAALRRTRAFLAECRVLLTSPGFLRYLAMCVITVNLKSVFRHLDATLPKFQQRAFGCDAPIGLIYSINPAIIVGLVPAVGALTTRIAHFDAIHWGAYASALSPLWLAAWSSEWAAAAFVATLSLGEAVWSPRWYDYSMSVAPDGREGIFTALATAPLFAATLPTGVLSGWLLGTYCPGQPGECGPEPADRAGDGAPAPAPRSASAGALAGLGSAVAATRRAALGWASDPLPPSVPAASGWRAAGLGGAAPRPAWAAGLAAEAPSGLADPPAGAATCDGRSLWTIVALMTLVSPLLVLAFQRWLRPRASDFVGRDAPGADRLPAHDRFDLTDADPLAALANVCQAGEVEEEHLEEAAARGAIAA